MQLFRPQRRALGVGAHAGIHHAHMEAACVGGVSSFIAFSRTPGVPKSLLWLPTEMIRVS
jgi:hypothetical protein